MKLIENLMIRTCWLGYTQNGLSPSLTIALGIEETCRSTGSGNGCPGDGFWLAGPIYRISKLSLKNFEAITQMKQSIHINFIFQYLLLKNCIFQ